MAPADGPRALPGGGACRPPHTSLFPVPLGVALRPRRSWGGGRGAPGKVGRAAGRPLPLPAGLPSLLTRAPSWAPVALTARLVGAAPDCAGAGEQDSCEPRPGVWGPAEECRAAGSGGGGWGLHWGPAGGL